MRFNRYDNPETSEIAEESHDLVHLLLREPKHGSEIVWNGTTVAYGVVLTSRWKRWEVDPMALAEVARERVRRGLRAC